MTTVTKAQVEAAANRSLETELLQRIEALKIERNTLAQALAEADKVIKRLTKERDNAMAAGD